VHHDLDVPHGPDQPVVIPDVADEESQGWVVAQFLAHLARATNMRVLTPPSALEGDCAYLGAIAITSARGNVVLAMAKWARGS
jgi:hypothetical protein